MVENYTKDLKESVYHGAVVSRIYTNTYVYVGALSAFGLAIGGYLLYSKFKKPKQTQIDVPTHPAVKTSTEPKRDIFEML